MSIYEELIRTIQLGNITETENLVKRLLDQGKSFDEIIEKGIILALNIVGEKFSTGECFIPEMLIAARACKKSLDILKPLLVKANYKPIGKIVIGSAKGDLHDIGKNIVSMMLESAGFEVNDLGVDVSPEKFVEVINTFNPQIVAISCLLTTTVDSVRVTIEKIKEAKLRNKIKVIIGGPPMSDEFAKKIGADFFGKDAYAGVEIARRIVSS